MIQWSCNRAPFKARLQTGNLRGVHKAGKESGRRKSRAECRVGTSGERRSEREMRRGGGERGGIAWAMAVFVLAAEWWHLCKGEALEGGFGGHLLPEKRIVGGTVAGEFLGLHMAHVMIRYWDTDGTGLCSGSVVGRRWILTTAHCFMGHEGRLSGVARRTYAVVGELEAGLRAEDGRGVYWAKALYVHAEFRGGDGDFRDFRNDVGLVELRKAVRKEVRTVRLGEWGMVQAGMMVSAGGFGRLGEGAGAARWLMRTELQVKAFEVCREVERFDWRRFLADEGMICAVSVGWPHRGETDTCYGDSGGPLYVVREGRLIQLGVTSFGTGGCAEEGTVAWYMRVAMYRAAIRRRMVGNGTDWAVVSRADAM